jgi:hypothetical protein
MDTDQLISHSRARFEHEAARRTLREKYQAKLTFAYCGGMWSAGPELLSVLNCCTMDKEVVIEDLYHNPVKVNTKELWNMAAERWQECMNAWLVEYTELNQNR